MFKTKKYGNKIGSQKWNCGKEEVDNSKRLTFYEYDKGFNLIEEKTNFLGFWKTVKVHNIPFHDKDETSLSIIQNIADQIVKRIPGKWYDDNWK